MAETAEQRVFTEPSARQRDQSRPYDLVIRGGEVLDPSQSLRGPRDVAFAFGRVAAVAPAGSIDADAARMLIDATGKLVTPGLVDLHTHVYVGGSELVIPADEVCSVSGCTTVVDAGTAGANTMLGLYRLAQREIRTRVYAFVHISGIGLAGHPHGESRDLTYLEPELAARSVLTYPGFVLGVKVRQTRNLVGENGLEPLRRAVQAAEIAQRAIDNSASAAGQPASDGRKVRVMVHYGSAPAPIGELLELLRPGDVATHCFNGGTNGVLDANGKLERGVIEARERGVQFDLGHGRGSFSYRVGKAAFDQGFWPDTISTDLHSGSVNYPVVDMPTTMSKWLDIGMPLEEVVRRSTAAPAQFINAALPPRDREPLLGTLQPGAPGDAAVFDLQQGEFDFADSTRYHWTGSQRLVPLHTVLGGRPWGRPYAHPYLVP
jgi:dihydroorotase